MSSRPSTMAEAVRLARLREVKLTEARRSWSKPTSNCFPPPSSMPPLVPPILLAPTTAARFPIKRLTPAEMQSHRDKGLYYNCDEKFSPAHHYPPLDELNAQPQAPTTSEISYHALAGYHSFATLCFMASIQGTPVQVLVDSGSTHNFVQSRVARYLGLAMESSRPLSVLVGNGTTLQSEGIIKGLTVKFPYHTATIEAVVFPLVGVDLVFGV
ncbi:hypothetical protein NE237_007918 [Protea cynaroides]|uniref:Uncharacterized protein n=1 Tax=Protea cynaroides TaxID=273540 RepID=A0A9Q0QWY3_9MAGN|nr:hypothetical protein NE237_007918 [Protea cynaroides]